MARVTRGRAAAAAAPQSDSVAAPPAKTTSKTKKADASTSVPSMDGCFVILSGTFPGHTHANLHKQLTAAGATIAKTVAAASHLVTTPEDFAKPSSKVAAAKSKDVPTVNIDWVWDSLEKGRQPVGPTYTFEPTKKRPIAVAKASDDDAADASSDDQPDNDVSKPKKRKTAKDAKASKASTDTASVTPALNGPVKDESKPTKTEVEKKTKVALAEGGIANTKDLVVPVDPSVHFAGGLGADFGVYIDPHGLIYDASLNQTNAQNNNNKFYIVQVYESKAKKKYHCWTRWGRVGEQGQSALLGAGSLEEAIKHFEKKFKDKSGLRWADRTNPPKPGKYAFVELSYDPDSESEDDNDKGVAKGEAAADDVDATSGPVCTLEKPIRELVELIFNLKFFSNTMQSFNYDANKLPLGKLASATITRGFQALKDLSGILTDPTTAALHDMSAPDAIQHFSNLYYSVIPHSFGRNRPPVISTVDLLKREVEMLESLSDMKAASDIIKSQQAVNTDPIHPLDRQFQGLGLEEMTPLNPSSEEFKLLATYLEGSKGATHHYTYDIVDIFRIERQGERDRFTNSKFATMKSDRRLLWHGSRATNFGGILSQGLRIAPPEAPVSGYMFDKGIYLADMSSKSAGYTCSYSSDGNALLLLCEAELGAPMQELVNAKSDAASTAKQGNMSSTWGQGRTGPLKWVDGSIVHPSLKGVKMPDTTVPPGETKVKAASLYYNEYICYDVAQVQLRYLFRVKM